MMRPPSRSSTLSQIVADVLRQSIQDGVYKCGERLVELAIAHELNVSQNTARDALHILEQEGWVVKRPRLGVHVREFSRSEAEELYALRIALEQLTLRWALTVATDDDLAGLRLIVSEAETFVELENGHGARQALFTFHVAFLHIAHKPQTAELLGRIHNQCRLLENLREDRAPRTPDAWEELVSDYDELVAHMEARHIPAACADLADIITADVEHILRVLD